MAGQLTKGKAAAGRKRQWERYSCTRGELNKRRTGPWGSEVRLEPLGREHDQDLPAKGWTGKLGMYLEIARRRCYLVRSSAMELSCTRWSRAAKGMRESWWPWTWTKVTWIGRLRRRLWQAQSRLACLDEQEMVSLR